MGATISLASKATRAASSKKRNTCSPSRVFPPQGQWEKGHGRLDCRRLARVAVTPEDIGLHGCWQVIAVERESHDLTKPDEEPSKDVGIYAASLELKEHDDAAILGIIRGHWAAIENGTHYRRDVTLGEDACRTTERQGAAALACLRNLAIGVYELEKERGRTKVDTLNSWCEQQTFRKVWPILQR